MRSLRSYLEKLEVTFPDQLIRVREPVDWRYEVTSYVEEMSKRDANPALLFENIKGYPMPLLINIFGHIDRINLALEGASRPLINRLDLYSEWNNLIDKEIPPMDVEGGPVKDICSKSDDVDLTSLPILKFYEQDAGRYITSGLLVARDPNNPDVINLSYARMQLKGRDRLGTSLHSRGNMWHYFERSKALGKPLDVAVIIGAHPAVYLAAAAKITEEYSVAGSLLGERIELVRAETVDLPVPAQAEIVLEGRILLEEEDEGPFTEYTGYLSGRSTRNVIHVSAITRRRDAIYLTIAPSNSHEHLLLSGLPKQARIYKSVRDFMPVPALMDLHWPTSGTHYVCFVSLEKSKGSIPGLAKQVALSLLGLDPYLKVVAVFTDDTDVSDTIDSLSAIASRCDFKVGSGIEILGGVFAHRLDPSSIEEGVSSKILIDATGLEKGMMALPSGSYLKGKTRLTGVKNVFYPREGDTRLCVVQVRPDFDDLDSLLGKTLQDKCRLTICVDEDVDIRDANQVLRALATRFQPAQDTIISDGKAVIDARKPENWKAAEATVPIRSRERINKD